MRPLCLLLALVAASVSAQSTQEAGTRWVLVEGEATVEVPPDLVTVRFAIDTRGRDEDLFARHESNVAAVLRAVRAFGIPDRDIALQDVTFGQDGRDRTARRVVAVETDSLRIVPDLVASLVDAGATQILDVRYGLQDPDAHADRAIDAAMERAREKAERMATASGARLGPVRAISEAGVMAPVDLSGRNVLVGLTQSRDRGGYAAGAQTVRARVVVQYDLLPAATTND